MREVWYHQIWIQNYLGFIVSDLMYRVYSNSQAELAKSRGLAHRTDIHFRMMQISRCFDAKKLIQLD
jgi:hypothetical protein